MPGPSDVDPTRVERLGAAFALFINDLLAAEVGRSGLLGFQLDINSQTNTADGGVDAALWSASATGWLPEGDSVWQFKSSDLEPAECKAELTGAAFARDLMRNGATYVLVLGRPLVGAPKESRLNACASRPKRSDSTAARYGCTTATNSPDGCRPCLH